MFEKECSLGFAAFFPKGIKTCSFGFDLKSVLGKLEKPVSKDSVVVVKDRAGNMVKFNKFSLRFYQILSDPIVR